MLRAAVTLGLAALLAACSSGATPVDTPTTSPQLTGSAYVAFGDSFTAGPGLPDPQPNAGYCQRSALNWPSLLASEINATSFTDLSCSGATTADQATTAQSTDKLGTATELVTISVGGNDGGLFSSLISACSNDAGACAPFVNDQVPALLQQTVPAIVSFINQVRDKAPDAQVVLVGYLRITPLTGTCDVLGIPPNEVTPVDEAEQLLEQALAKAADQADITYVSLVKASRGHDACAGAKAWTNGARTSDGDGIFFHPRKAGMRGAAATVNAALTASGE